MIDKVGMIDKIKNRESCASCQILPRSGSCFSLQQIYHAIALQVQAARSSEH